ncbi:MAG: TIGR02679 family protein [Magnetospirillum sp.]|nr:TIGR02679 family protein [Magnetospirillum sp.]
MTGTDPRLVRLLGGQHLADLRRRLRRQFDGPAPASFRLTGLSADERAALAALMGKPPSRAKSIDVDVADIDGALRRAGLGESLKQALERLDGPIVDRAVMRADRDARWLAVVGNAGHPALAGLLQTPTGLGLLKRLARQSLERARQLCVQADRILGRLPADGVARSKLAAETLGDAHALDPGRPPATLVLAALRGAGLQSEDAGSEPAKERVRDQWARAGVLVNELARPALVLNLPVRGGQLFLPGEPGYASLRLLVRSPPAWDVRGHVISICENPNLVAIAADRLGAKCAPLVCTDGMPAAAQRTLLRQLADGGARLCYHGDFDWPGISIANQMIGKYGAKPWRFCAGDYDLAFRGGVRSGYELAGQPVVACWDAGLAPALRARGLAIAEEGLADDLIKDLAGREWDLVEPAILFGGVPPDVA